MAASRAKYYLPVLVLLLIIMDIFLFRLDWQNSHRGLTMTVLDVGQGDSIFIESPTGAQIMFDGGPARKVLGPLQKIISPFDKTIDAIVITNPDADHIGGFLDILKNYEIGTVLEPGTFNDSKTFQNLKTEIKNKNIPNFLAQKGMRLNLGGGVFVDILFPDRDVSTWSVNDGSIVARLVYGGTSVLLAGDSTTKTEKIILSENSSDLLNSEILKVGHHRSRSSTSENFLKAVSPKYALVSVGRIINIGHPHLEVLNVLQKFKVEILRTDLRGTLVLKCARMDKCEIN